MQQLNRMQRRQVSWFLHFKNKPVSIGSLAWYNRRIYAILGVAAVLTMALEYWAFGCIGAAFVAVAFGAIFLRDIAFYRRSKNTWPIFLEVIDWEKLEQLGKQSGFET